PALLEELEIPLPPIEEQEAIVKEHADLTADARAALISSSEAVVDAYAMVLRELGIEWREQEGAPASVAVDFSRVESWSVRKAREVAGGETFDVAGNYVVCE